jgi:thiol:disulfide interchange protein DsbD
MNVKIPGCNFYHPTAGTPFVPLHQTKYNRMKGILYSALLIFCAHTATAQLADPVRWVYSAKKIADKTYEVHVTASIQPNWHLYSQQQPDDAIAIPTSIRFNKNPLVTVSGATREVGKLEHFKDEKLKLSANQYADRVDFVQVVKLKAAAKTNITGSVEYQTCDDKKCLPPKTVNFTVALN